jgi:plasmid stability protein
VRVNRIEVTGLSDGLVQRLQTRASAKGHSLEEAVLDILNGALPGSTDAVPSYPGSAKEALEQIRAMYSEIGWADDVVLPPRRCCEHVCVVEPQP